MKYTINRGPKEIGQFSLNDIQALMNAGVILPTDYFWFQGMSEWKPVSSLFAERPKAPAQVVPPSLPASGTQPLADVTLTKEIGPSCPSCYSSDVIKAYAAYEASLQQHSLNAGTSSGFRLWADGETINKVGIKCAPPEKPELLDRSSTPRMLTVILGLVAFAFSLAGFVLMSKTEGSRGLAIMVGLAAAVGSFMSYRAWTQSKAAAQSSYEVALKKYKADLKAYARTWRCNKCGLMYQA